MLGATSRNTLPHTELASSSLAMATAPYGHAAATGTRDLAPSIGAFCTIAEVRAKGGLTASKWP